MSADCGTTALACPNSYQTSQTVQTVPTQFKPFKPFKPSTQVKQVKQCEQFNTVRTGEGCYAPHASAVWALRWGRGGPRERTTSEENGRQAAGAPAACAACAKPQTSPLLLQKLLRKPRRRRRREARRRGGGVGVAAALRGFGRSSTQAKGAAACALTKSAKPLCKRHRAMTRFAGGKGSAERQGGRKPPAGRHTARARARRGASCRSSIRRGRGGLWGCGGRCLGNLRFLVCAGQRANLKACLMKAPK